VISDVYEGKLHPRIAAALAPLMHLRLRVLEKTEGGEAAGKVGAAVARNDRAALIV